MCFKEVRQGHRFKDIFLLPSTSPWPNSPQKLISWGQLFFYKYSCCTVTVLQWKSGCLLPAVLNSALLKELGQRGVGAWSILPCSRLAACSAWVQPGAWAAQGKLPLGMRSRWQRIQHTTHAEGCGWTFPALSMVDGYIKISACMLPSYYRLPNCSGDVHCVEFHRSNYP